MDNGEEGLWSEDWPSNTYVRARHTYNQLAHPDVLEKGRRQAEHGVQYNLTHESTPVCTTNTDIHI